MKKIIFFLLWVVLIFYSCNGRSNANNDKIGNGFHENNNDSVFYLFRNDTIVQKAKLIFNDELHFKLNSQNLNTGLSSSLSGVATIIESENAGMIEDEDGFSHFVDVYYYIKGGCTLYFNIENDKYDKLVINASPECDVEDHIGAPFYSLGILRKQ